MTLVVRLLLAFTAVVAAGMVATLVTSLSLGSFSRDDQNVANAHAAVITVHEAQMILSRQDALLASYVATAERKYHTQFEGQVINLEHALDQARNLLVGHSEAETNIVQLDGSTKKWLESSGKSARVLSVLDETWELRAKITDQAGRVVAELNNSIAKASTAKERARHVVEVASLSGPAAGVVVSIAVCIWLLTTLQKPMCDLALVVRSFAEGSLQVDIPHAARPDEIGTIARSLGAFRDALSERGALIQASIADKSRLADQDRMVGHVRSFEAKIQRVLNHVNVQIGAMDDISQALTGVASELTRRVSSALSASQGTNSNVSAISGAVNELARSASEIAQQGQTLNSTFSQAERQTKEATVRFAELTTE